MSDLVAYAASFVVEQLSEITITDPDQDGDLQKYTIEVVYKPPNGTPLIWPIQNTIPIVTTWKDDQGVEHSAVNTLVLQVLPKVPPAGCFGVFFPSFPRLPKPKTTPDGSTTGTVTGTLTPPSSGASRDEVKRFVVSRPSIFHGIPA